MKKWLVTMAFCVGCGVIQASAAYAAEEVVVVSNMVPAPVSAKPPLNEAFDQLVVIPYDFQGKAFVNGHNAEIQGDYEIVQKNNRVLVPIRLMGYLATESERGSNYWEVNWDQGRPNEVVLISHAKQKTIKYTVNSKTMLVNNQPVDLDVPAQKVNGRIVLPLRSAAEALEKKIDWLNGLILLGDVSVDLQHPQTLTVERQIKKQLSDTRKRVDYEDMAYPLMKNGDSVYFHKLIFQEQGVTEELYRKEAGKKAVKVPLVGKPIASRSQKIGDELYYATTVKEGAELHAFHLTEQTSRKISSLHPWNPTDGWLVGMHHLDGELYVNLHYGDLTMGSETLYKVEQGALKEVVRTKSLSNLVKEDEQLIYTDFQFMGPSENLYRLDLQTGERESIGEAGYSYGIFRTVEENGSIGYGGGRTFYVHEGYLYTIGFKEGDLADRNAVYKINLSDQTQVKLTTSAKHFWMDDGWIYYIDGDSGALFRVDLDGAKREKLVDRDVQNAKVYNGNVYYTSGGPGGNAAYSNLGALYRYGIADGVEVKLSERSVSSFFVGKAGVYYASHGYEPGLYRVDGDGRNVALVNDYIDFQMLTDEGMLYLLMYEEGVFAAK